MRQIIVPFLEGILYKIFYMIYPETQHPFSLGLFSKIAYPIVESGRKVKMFDFEID